VSFNLDRVTYLQLVALGAAGREAFRLKVARLEAGQAG
jgi:hypothetical protein